MPPQTLIYSNEEEIVMNATKFMLWGTGTAWLSIASIVGFAAPGVAQLNQSDITGTNVFESYAPDFFEFEGLDPALAERAEELSQELDEANRACAESQASAASFPRRFARGPGNSSGVCVSPACQRLNQLMDEARSLIAQVEAQRAEINRSGEGRPW